MASETSVPIIDFSDFESRREEIADTIWNYSTKVGFFYVSGHGIPQEDIDTMFAMSSKFFALPREIKSKTPWDMQTNNGWEAGTEVLDEATTDLKETYNLGHVNMEGKWASDSDCPGLKDLGETFQRQCEQFSSKIMSCFALKLGFDLDFFDIHHDPTQPDCTKLLRLLYYPAVTEEQVANMPPNQWRAGAHTDYGCVTLLFQRPGEVGLEVCPGFDPTHSHWIDVPPVPGTITINIGDSMMRWSDDKLMSNIHRVRVPRPGDPLAARYSMAYFNQANRSAVIQGPEQKYPPITAGDYLSLRLGLTYR